MYTERSIKKKIKDIWYIYIIYDIWYMIYDIDIYIYVVESRFGRKITFFWVKTSSKFIFSFFVFQKYVFLQGEWDLQKIWTEKEATITIFESKFGPIMLHNILGPNFDSTLDQVLTQHFDIFSLCYAEATLLMVFSAKICTLKPTPKKLELYLWTQLR